MANETIETPKSKKDTYMESFRQKHPDWQDDDEEGFYGALSADDASSAEMMKGYEDREAQVSEALSGSPLNAALFMDAMDGKPIPLAILERYPEEVKAWMDDPSNADALKKVFEDKANKIEENKKLEAEKEANKEESNKLIDEMIASGEITEDQVEEYLKFLGNIGAGLMMNHVEKEWLLAAKNALNHDADVSAAKTQGEIDGRNANITAKRQEKKLGGNTHAGLGGSNAAQKLSSRETAMATSGSARKSMWDGMKTNKLN